MGVVVVDDRLRVIVANEALTRMGQSEREEILAGLRNTSSLQTWRAAYRFLPKPALRH
jgi:hypothetical protein